MVSTDKMPVAELAVAVKEHLTGRGYSSVYLHTIALVQKAIVRYCTERNEVFYRDELGQQFLSDRLRIEKRLGHDRLSVLKRAVQMMSDYQQFGTIVIRRRSNRCFPERFAAHCTAYIDHLYRNGRTNNTVKSITHSMHNLVAFLDGIGVESFEALTLGHMNEYIKCSLCNYCQSSAATRLRDARNFLMFLYERGIVSDNIAPKLIKVSSSSTPVFLPSAFKAEDIEKLLATIDQKSPTGKRAYAVILLVAKTGLRLSDMQNLKFENIDWDQKVIRIVQVKTKEPLTLPLTMDVGWALIEYITNGRPTSDSPHIFLHERAPYIPLTNFDNILVKHMRLAKIPAEYLRHHGLHALRHGLATTLLENDVSIEVIQAVLGHINITTTQKYTAVNVEQLRECALEVPVI